MRGGDWDDNGTWRVMHTHNWTTIHVQIKNTFNLLGQLESGAITTMAFNPNPTQKAEALFLRSLSQFYFLDLFGQVPYRQVVDYNSIGPAPVLQPNEAIDTLTTILNSIIPQLPEANLPYKASPDAARFLLMKVLLNKVFLSNATFIGMSLYCFGLKFQIFLIKNVIKLVLQISIKFVISSRI